MGQVYTEAMLARKLAGFKKFSAVVILAVMIFATYVGIQSYLRATRILSDHSTLQAKVTQAEHRQERTKKGRLKDIYEVSYSFALGGKAYAATFHTNKEKFDKYKSAGILDVAYSNRNHAEFDRKELLLTQSSLFGLLKRLGIIFVGAIVFFSIIGFIVKGRLKKKLGTPLAS